MKYIHHSNQFLPNVVGRIKDKILAKVLEREGCVQFTSSIFGRCLPLYLFLPEGALSSAPRLSPDPSLNSDCTRPLEGGARALTEREGR